MKAIILNTLAFIAGGMCVPIETDELESQLQRNSVGMAFYLHKPIKVRSVGGKCFTLYEQKEMATWPTV